MDRLPTGLYPYFLSLYGELRSRTNNDPRKVAAFARESESIGKLVNDLGTLTRIVDETLASSPRKYSPQVPSEFPQAYRDYRERFADSVTEAFWDIRLEEVELELELTPEQLEELGEKRRSKLALADPVVAPDPDYDEDFNPLEHSLATALENLLWYADAQMDNHSGSEYADDYRLANGLRIGLGAWDYLQAVIGLDPDGVSRRWRSVPHIFVPKQVSDKHGLTEHGSLYDLLDDAVRAYVFGAPTAAITMCRAICETVLKEHYDLETRMTDGREHPLAHIIWLAEQKYYWVKHLKLGDRVRRANRILHAYTSSSKVSEDDEIYIVEFLTTAKALIERAPE